MLVQNHSCSMPLTTTVRSETVDWLLNGAERSQDGGLVLHNWPSNETRRALRERLDECRKKICDHNRTQIMADITAMLTCYTFFMNLGAEDAKKLATKYFFELKGAPTWAVTKACYQIREGTAPGISQIHAPSTIQVRTLAMSIAQPIMTEAATLDRLLSAKKYVPPLTNEQRDTIKTGMESLARGMKERAAVNAERNDAAEKALVRMVENSRQAIMDDYREHGIEPIYTSLGVVSPSLLKSVGKLSSKGLGK